MGITNPLRGISSRSVFLGAVLFFSFLTLGFSTLSYQRQKQLTLSLNQTIHFEELKGDIGRIDEVLTMSAKMAAATGDLYWVKRYEQFEPVQEGILKKITVLFPHYALAKQTTDANQAKIQTELISLALVKKGANNEAMEILSSRDYENQKNLYYGGMEQFKSQLKLVLQDRTSSLKTSLSAALFCALFFLFFAIAGWDLVYRSFKSINQRLADMNQNLENHLNERARQLIHSARLISVGQIVAGIVHEINNPLAIISGNISQLTQCLNNPEKLASKIEAIQHSCTRISNNLNGIRKFSSTNSDSAHTPHPIRDIVNEALALTAPRSKRHGIPISCDIKTNAISHCNEVEMEQVLVNLINNSIDSIDSSLEKWVKIKVFDEAQSVVVQVMDSGSTLNRKDVAMSITKELLDGQNATFKITPDTHSTSFEIRLDRIMPALAV